jgi:glycerate kinase
MRVICAPDSFKESLSAVAAAEAMGRGVRRAAAGAAVDLCPIADGGEGTVDAMLAAMGGRRVVERVLGPTGEQVEAAWGLLPDGSAVIEMAAASGLSLVTPDRRDPTRTTTYGVGQLIAAAVNHGCTRILLGIGGSATNDGGCGMAQALGVRFLDSDGRTMTEPISGGMLPRIARIDVAGRLACPPVVVACDVTNPLTGPDGAAAIYGPQKGASLVQVSELDCGLRHLARLCREQLGRDIEHLPGAGAAGGLGGGAVVHLAATLRSGIDLVLDAVDFDARVRDCTLCLTGEGRLDGQSLSGKACLGVARAAAKHGVPTIALVGCAAPDADRTLAAGLHSYHVIGAGLPADESMRRASELLERAAAALQWPGGDP